MIVLTFLSFITKENPQTPPTFKPFTIYDKKAEKKAQNTYLLFLYINICLLSEKKKENDYLDFGLCQMTVAAYEM